MKKCLIFLVSLFLMIGTMWAQTFPETSTADAPKYYTIASYNRGGYLTNVGEGRGVEHIDVTKGSLWYFTQADENGGVHFCNYAGGYLAADKTVSETAGVWYVLSNGVNTNGVSISSTNPISDDSCIDANSYNSGVGAWRPSANDWQGTTWVFAEVTDFSTIFNVDEAKASAKAEIDVLASVSGNYPDATEVKERIDNINAEGTSPVQYEAAIDAVNQCVADYKDAVLQALGGKYFTINTPARDNGFMKVVGNQVVGVAEASSSAALWQFECADGVVKVFNPYTGKYLCEPGDYSANVAVTENAAEAGAYQLVVNQAAANDAAKVKLTSNGKSIHMGGNSVLVRWDDGGASEWTIAEVEVDITKDITELLGANADNHAETPTLGQYSTAGYTALQDALNTVTTLKQVADAVAAFEATKCLPVFTIDGVWGYALGMSIYESESGSLLWRETDRTESMLWSFDMTDTIVGVTDKVVVRNLATGNLFWGASFIKVTETSESIADDGLFLFYTEGTGNPVHADQAGQSIVRWNNLSANSASAWRFTYAGTTYGINDLPEIPEDEVDNSIKIDAGTDGWIEGTEWFDESAAILSYTSPLYHFQDKVETFRITVNKNKGGGAFFCLSELTLYDGNGEKIALTADNIASNADHNTLNPNSPDGGGLVALLDGQTGTFFHSAWSNMPAEAHYLEITLPNGGYDAFCFRMLSRAFNGGSQTHTFPGEMVVTTSVALESTETPNIPEGGYNEPIEGVVSNLSETNPAKCYTISTNGRGAWAVDAEAVRLSYVPDGNIDATDSRQQFAILSVNDEDYYLYSVSEKMFVKSDGSLDLLTGDAIEFVDASASQGTGRVQVHFRDFANSYINVNTGQGLIINHWNTIDEGNAVLIAEAGDFDAAEALAILADPEAAALAALVAQAQAIIDVNADNHAVEPALGQYLTEAYEALVAVVNAEDKTSSSLRDAIAAFEDSKCLPVFTIDGANDYAAGMSIYDDGGQYPRWKATDRSDESMLWAFEMTDTVVGVTDKVVVKNLATGNLFMGNPPYNASYLRVAETTEDIADDGLFLMFREEDTEYAIWASQTGMVVPSQGIFSANSTSAWKFTFAGTTYGINDLPEVPDTPVVPDTPEGVVNNLASADPAKCYTVTTMGRGGWAVDAAGTSFTCTTAEGLTVDESDPRQQFAILSLNAQDYYLYSVSAKKFVKRDGSLVAGMADAIEFVDASSMGAGRVMVRFDEDHIINVSDVSRRMEINNWSSLDEGNAVAIIEAGDFDATEALAMLSTPAVPDTSSVGLTNLAAADPTKCYTISTNGRGAWAINAEGTYFSTTTVEEYDIDATDARQQFAILSANGEDYYLYSVSAKKFVKRDRTLAVGVGDAIEFVDASSFEEGRVLVRFRDYANANINIGGDYQITIDRWSTVDVGNAVLIAEAGDFDAAEALAALADPEAAELAALVAQVQELVEANAANHAVEPALGQYSTVAYDALVAVANTDSASKASLEAAIAAFEAAKCLPVFTITGFDPDKSIYESTNHNGLYWKELDRTDETMLWVFYMTDTIVGVTDRVVVKNLATGNYFGNGTFIQVTETEEEIADDGYFLIYYEGTGTPLCAYRNGQVMGGDAWSVMSDAAWKFTYAGTTYGINELPVEPDVLEPPVFTDTVDATMPLDYHAAADGWIEGTEWYDEAELIVSYTSPMYRFEEKVETFRIAVVKSQGKEQFFCLSELEFYEGNGQKIELTEGNVTSNADHNALNPSAPDGGGIAALFDGKTTTYFHSAWQNIPDEVHYLEVTLPNGGYDTFGFRMISRANDGFVDQSHTFPRRMIITDGDYQRMALSYLLDEAEMLDLYPFPELGYYYDDFSYLREAISEARDLVDNNASEAECEAMVTELLQALKQYKANETPCLRMPEPGKVYHIISAFENFYVNQQVEKAITVNDTLNTLWWEDVNSANLQQGFMFEPVLNGLGNIATQEMNSIRNGVKVVEKHYFFRMKHAATGLYVDYDDAGRFHLVEQPCTLRLSQPGNKHEGQFNILTSRYMGDNSYQTQYLHAGDHNGGVAGTHQGAYGGIGGVSSGIISYYGGAGTPAAWYIREMHELPYTMPVSDAVFRSGFIHFDAADVITLTADRECSFAGLALRDEYGNWLHSLDSEVSGNTITLTLERKIASCAFQFTNNEGVSSVTFDAEASTVEVPSLQLVGVTPDSEIPEPMAEYLKLSFNEEVIFTLPEGGIVVRGINTGKEFTIREGIVVENTNGSHIFLHFLDEKGTYERIATADTYTYTIPAGAIKSVDGEVFPETTLTFTIYETFPLVSYSPRESSKLETIVLYFDREIVEVNMPTEGLTIVDLRNTPVTSIKKDVTISEDKKTVVLELESPITTAGRYFWWLYNGMFLTEDGVENGYDNLDFTVIEDTPVISTDYAMKAQNVKGRASNVVNVPIEMDNVTAVNAFQFDLYLPEGVSVVTTTEDDEVLYDIAFNKDRSKSSHVLAVEPQADGALRVAAYSTSNASFVGNSGVLVNVAVAIDDVDEGDYVIAMRNIRMVTKDEEGNAVEKLGADYTATLTVENTLPGDVNSDGNVTMLDVVMTVNAVMEKEQENFNANAADLNGDGQITMVDVVGVLQLVLTEGSSKAPVRRDLNRMLAMPELNTCDLKFMGNGGVVLPVALCNGEDYSAFQLDVQLPAGVELADVALAGRAKASHTMAWNTLSDGTIRVVAYAVNNATFSDDEGALLNLVLNTSDELSSDAEVILTDGLFASVDGLENRAPAVSVLMRSDATSVGGAVAGAFWVYGTEGAVVVECGADTAVSIHAVTGKLVQQATVEPGKNIIPLPCGVYIVNGNKVIVK